MNDERIFLDENEGDDVFKVIVMCAGAPRLEEGQQEGLENTNKEQSIVKSGDNLKDQVESG